MRASCKPRALLYLVRATCHRAERGGVRILLPLPYLTVDLDPADENSTLARQSARKAEISRDFSAFFAVL